MDLMQGLEALGSPQEAKEGLDAFRRDLLRFNASLPLISRQDSSRVAVRLVLESVSAALRLPLAPGQRLMDLGTGAGIPGIPLALVRTTAEVALLERRGGHCSFLRREVAALGLNVPVLEGTAESWAQQPPQAGSYDWVTLKAVRSPGIALELARPFLGPEGRAVLFQDPSWTPEVEGPWKLQESRNCPVPGFPEAAIFLFAPA